MLPTPSPQPFGGLDLVLAVISPNLPRRVSNPQDLWSRRMSYVFNDSPTPRAAGGRPERRDERRFELLRGRPNRLRDHTSRPRSGTSLDRGARRSAAG